MASSPENDDRIIDIELQERVDALAISLPEKWMVEIGTCFLDRGDSIILRGRTMTKTAQLREDIPHPVRAFGPCGNLRQSGRITAGLGIEKAGEGRIVSHQSSAPCAGGAP